MKYRLGRTSKSRTKKLSRNGMTYHDIKQRTSALSKRIDNYLRTIKTGGGRLESWQGKFPVVGSIPWDPSNNITKYPQLANQVFNQPGLRGGRRRRRSRRGTSRSKLRRRSVKGGAYHIPQNYFGRSPVGYFGPKSTPYPSLKDWSAAGGRRSKRT